MVVLYKARAVGMEYHTDCTIEPTVAESKAPKNGLQPLRAKPEELQGAGKVDLPRAQRVKAADPTVYQVEVLEKENKRVKVHWASYSHMKDEWIGCIAERKY